MHTGSQVTDHCPLGYLSYNRKNVVRSVTTSFLIGASSNFQITRTAIKSRVGSILGQISIVALSYLPLSDKTFSHRGYLCLSCICLLAMQTLICVTFSVPSGVGGWLQRLLVALPGLFYLPFL